MMAHGNVRSRGVFFPSSSPVLSLSLPHLLSHDSSKKYFITSTNPPPLLLLLLHNYGSYVFFPLSVLSVCLYSLPQPAQIYRAALWLCKRHAGKEEGHGFYNCSSPMLTARAAKVTHSVWLSHVHRAPRHFVFITEHATHTHTHTFNQPQSCISCQCATK